MQDTQDPQLSWRDDGVPVSDRFDDPYFSVVNGLEETRHVFLAGNDLPARFRDGFHIAELGFGTGLNMLATWLMWQETGQEGTLHFTSFEAFPMQTTEMEQALAHFPEAHAIAAPFLEQWAAGKRVIEMPGLVANIHIGDAREILPGLNLLADAWFLDGFAPAKNPELWSEEILHGVANHTAEGGTFATYTAAGFVRRTLDAAGFDVTRVPGFGRKRHMSTGVLRT
ncbi:tRNA (5-methylaminomethyl-2-thiouridine)(34)-methyltransferase MnmD [Halocynthiibacter styelae]|uniref:tRNA (5-methylaminomethyl-2-thiouridine)(34)-methyltransferase MnmD n=1 Tax=Halocynthiibacter styelae TaxID=2761955 RepID=A0A8J7LUR2_9RHOB|nr:tRNA (5-methylaminomethyl-2-thiouridine)(34)-methyltransferase MnmD [Paenihalocynthiibacter styelae]MBI1492877.1 tRNA (5-methylaminomethyl-2-thiouridine)(34)-methyltransferase MnmD [Paenihalocynthiibacter styelae]